MEIAAEYLQLQLCLPRPSFVCLQMSHPSSRQSASGSASVSCVPVSSYSQQLQSCYQSLPQAAVEDSLRFQTMLTVQAVLADWTSILTGIDLCNRNSEEDFLAAEATD